MTLEPCFHHWVPQTELPTGRLEVHDIDVGMCGASVHNGVRTNAGLPKPIGVGGHGANIGGDILVNGVTNASGVDRSLGR